MFKLKIFIAFIAIFINYCEVGAFNLSPVPNLEIKLPKLPTGLPQTRSSYFGFSIVLREKSILIGAPRAQSTLASQSTINETGAIYRCPLNSRRLAEPNPRVTCEPYVFEKSSNLYFTDHRLNEIRDHQWLGATMDGGTRDNEPLLVCAPRFDGGERYDEENHDYLHGICYSSADTLDDEPKKTEIWKHKPLTRDHQVYNGFYFFQIGQMGFSAHITPDNKEYIMGAPGVNNWSGSVVRFSTKTEEYDIPEEISKNQLTLNGYAVASGYLNSVKRNELYYVTTSPHENMELGQAYIYQYSRFADEDIIIYAILKGTQYGEYYGYAALVCDINGDQLDDVLITAPQYRLDGTIDIGAIYVYMNAGNFQFQRQIIEAPFTKEARFGTSISNLGDINRDGFNDIAVGAPLAGGNGAVVIYLGSKNGLEAQHSQLLSMPSIAGLSNGYFGHGLSKGVDIDGNGYNDLAVGAPNKEVVYIYRSYPVINVEIIIATTEPSLDLQAEYIEYRICFHINSDKIVSLELDIAADSKLRRITFTDNNAQRLRVQVLAARFERCHTFNASITFLSSQVFVPIRTTVSHSLTNDGKRQLDGKFCTNCAVLDPRTPNTTISVLKYRHGCASEVCNVDLSIEALNVPTDLIMGSSNVLPVKYYITNKFEKAFDTQVTISNSLNLTLTRTPPNCYENTYQQMICDIAKDHIFLEDFEYLDVEFDLSNITDKDELIITATVTSMGNELRADDNKVEQKIKLRRYSVLEVVGFPVEPSYYIRDDEPTMDIEYSCKLQNLGPSPVKDIDIWLHIPIAYNNSDSKQTIYVESNQINLNVSLESDEILHSVFEVGPSEELEKSTQNDATYTLRQHIRLPYNSTIFQFCNQSSTAICTRSMLKLSLLELSKSLTLNFKAAIKSAAVRDILQNGRYLALFMNVTAHSNANNEGYLNITQLILPIVLQYRPIAGTPLWVYIVAIIGGILLLAILTLALWKFGFFKRQTKEDMQELLNEKHESERMKEDTELNDGTLNETFEEVESVSRA